ncbi:MAG: hypothetical protein HOV81_40345 [Kofleriaceae bacterium]|nr:hypothetical protein [Kofleriaceae bacterium]
MNLGNLARVVTVAAACLAAVGSATSNSNPPAVTPQPNNSPPPPQEMDAARALGLWRSTFGAVKIEADNSHGGIQAGAVQGIWMYQRQGQEVIGYFSGNLRGNVLQFRWNEPNNPPLTGEGYLVFDQQGRQYSGRWWSDKRDRVGDWNGWRQASNQQPNPYGQPAYGEQPNPYGGQTYGGQGYGAQQPQPYAPQQQPYPPQQPQPYAPQQYPQQPPQQQPQPYYPQQQPQPQPYYPRN